MDILSGYYLIRMLLEMFACVCVVVVAGGFTHLVVYVLMRMAALSPSHSFPAGWRLHAL